MKSPWVVTMVFVCFGGALVPGQERAARMLPVGPPPATVAPLESFARIQLDRAESLLKAGPADEVYEVYRRVMDTHGDRFVEWPAGASPGPGDFARFGTLRELAWMRLGTLRESAPETFAAFRRQMDPQAKRWFDQAAEEQSTGYYQRIVDEAFLSSFGDDALLRLGDAALERGDFNTARRHWERIALGLRFVPNQHEELNQAANRPLWLPFAGVEVARAWPVVAPLFSQPGEPTELVYPDTDLSLPEVRARLTIASILEGNLERARVEIEILRQVAPLAEGTIAGRTGRLVELLQGMITAAADWSPLVRSTNWPTFAGSLDRNHGLPEIALLVDKPLWSVPLPRRFVESGVLSGEGVRVAEDAGGLLPYHPLIIQDLAIVQVSASREHVQSYQLRTGERALPAMDMVVGGEVLDRRAVLGVPRFAPCVAGTTLFLVDSLTRISSFDERIPAAVEAIDLAAERKLLWKFSPGPPLWSEGFCLAGPAAAAGPRLFVPLRSRVTGREETKVAALDARDGRPLWRQSIGIAVPAVEAAAELTHLLLTVDRGVVYCNTNNGLVAALEARTGRLLWITAYPRIGLIPDDSDPDRNRLHFYRDLNPCLVHRDVVVVAPTDCNRIFGLDAATGIPVWVTPAELAADAVHVLGVTQDRLVVSGECVYWFDVHAGRLLARYPEPFKAGPGFARPSPRGYGRGVLAGRDLYWPTRDAILVLGDSSPRQSDPWQPRVVRRIALADWDATGGNLAWGNDTLLVAGADRLWAFDAPRVR